VCQVNWDGTADHLRVDDVEAEPLEQPGQPFSQQHPVLGQHYPDHGC
jgi:hypothetical protein